MACWLLGLALWRLPSTGLGRCLLRWTDCTIGLMVLQTSNKLTYLLSYLLKSNTDCKLRTCDFHWNRRSTSTFIFLHFTGNVLCWGPASRSFCHAAPHQNVQLLRSRTRSHADAVRATQHARVFTLDCGHWIKEKYNLKQNESGRIYSRGQFILPWLVTKCVTSTLKIPLIHWSETIFRSAILGQRTTSALLPNVIVYAYIIAHSCESL